MTDLGTEFGVEVSNEGATMSHVFRGSVRLQLADQDGKTGGDAQVLHENESARVENRGNQGGGNRAIMLVRVCQAGQLRPRDSQANHQDVRLGRRGGRRRRLLWTAERWH